MPAAARSLCQCGGIKTAGKCDRCGAEPRTKHDRTTKQRGLGGQWRRKSERLRQLIPVCIPCWHNGRTTIATGNSPLHCHHVIKRKDAPELALDDDNLINVCVTCHTELDTMYERDRASYDVLAEQLKATRDTLT